MEPTPVPKGPATVSRDTVVRPTGVDVREAGSLRVGDVRSGILERGAAPPARTGTVFSAMLEQAALTKGGQPDRTRARLDAQWQAFNADVKRFPCVDITAAPPPEIVAASAALLKTASAHLEAVGVRHRQEGDRIVIEPDVGSPLGRYAFHCADTTGAKVSFDPIKRWRSPKSAASFNRASSTITLSIDSLRRGPGLNERHELVHALVDHYSQQPGTTLFLNGMSAARGGRSLPGAVAGYEKAYDRNELITYGDEVGQAVPRLRALVEQLRTEGAVGGPPVEKLRAELVDLPVVQALALAEQTAQNDRAAVTPSVR